MKPFIFKRGNDWWIKFVANNDTSTTVSQAHSNTVWLDGSPNSIFTIDDKTFFVQNKNTQNNTRFILSFIEFDKDGKCIKRY